MRNLLFSIESQHHKSFALVFIQYLMLRKSYFGLGEKQYTKKNRKFGKGNDHCTHRFKKK